MKLSKRLTRLNQSVDNDATSIWDIGCDHGQLGLSFLEREKVKEIHLVDPSALVIETLNQSLKDSYITIPKKIKVHHKRGQDITLSPERKAVLIAGMGGKEIIEILKSLLPQLGPRDIVTISPHRHLLLVREWLNSSELRLQKEEVVLDEGRFYPLITLRRDPELPAVDLYGREIWQSEEGELWRKHEIAVYKRHKDLASIRFYTYLAALNP